MKDKKSVIYSAPDLQTGHYTYELPPDRIALHPLPNRDESRLLVASGRSGHIEDRTFKDLCELIPIGSLLVLNDSKVMPARILCQKSTGGQAEALLLEPIRPTPNPVLCLEKGSPSIWKALLGGKRIRTGDTLTASEALSLKVLEKKGAEALIELEWLPPQRSLGELLERLGSIPLPPYLKRELVAEDASRYQTVYALHSGSVAAPTAGLHFSEALQEKLNQRGVLQERVTLHVGAGTFKPVESTRVASHEMHSERIEVTIAALRQISKALEPKPGRRPVIAVGTTSLRTLESLYWLGKRALCYPEDELLQLEQWEAYAEAQGPEVLPFQAFEALVDWLEKRSFSKLTTQSRLMIVPGYSFKVADWLITNFHQPGSSLILLVAAWMGENWRSVYQHALKGSYRFLSYGDSSLLMRSLSLKF